MKSERVEIGTEQIPLTADGCKLRACVQLSCWIGWIWGCVSIDNLQASFLTSCLCFAVSAFLPFLTITLHPNTCLTAPFQFSVLDAFDY